MTDHKPCDPADPCATAYDLASERNTLDGLLFETKDRLDAALAQVARLREALERISALTPYAANTVSADGHHAATSAIARAAHAETADTPAPAPASDGWIAWEGGECPVSPETLVDVRRGYRLAAGCLRWDHRGTLGDIVAYRIAGARSA